jgi:putative spermidine/putrescine transport system permease protein
MSLLAKKIDTSRAETGDAPLARPFSNRRNWDWLGMLPFILFGLLLLILPSVSIFYSSFESPEGGFTFNNIIGIFQRSDLLNSYKNSLIISLVTATLGALWGFLIAYAVISGGLPKRLRSFVLTFSGVASNFAGVPLAFAFIATIGNTGLITRAVNYITGVNVVQHGWKVYNLYGLSAVYLYFQLPLMILVISPALDGLKREWREASDTLGGTGWHYWRHVGIPILLPAVLGSTILLFGNAFGAYATAYAFAGSSLNLVTIVIGAQISGDVLFNPGMGNALALGMILIMSLSLYGYMYLMRTAARWTK